MPTKKKQKTIKFSEWKRQQVVNSSKLQDAVFQGGDRRYEWVGIGMIDVGKADGTEVLVTEDNGSVPSPRKRKANA